MGGFMLATDLYVIIKASAWADFGLIFILSLGKSQIRAALLDGFRPKPFGKRSDLDVIKPSLP